MTDERQPVTYRPDDQPEVEVLWDGEWRFGLLAEWTPSPDGRWKGWVRFNVAPGDNRNESFDQDEIRQLA